MGDLFLEKLCMGEQTFLGKLKGRMFNMGTNYQIMQGGGKVSQRHFPIICKSVTL